MLRRSRLDPFSARLLAIHQKNPSASTGTVDCVRTEIAEEQAAVAAVGAEGAEGAEGVEDPQPSAEPEIAGAAVELDPNDGSTFGEAMRTAVLSAQPQVSTGCAECGEHHDPASLESVTREIAALRARVAELESLVLPNREGRPVVPHGLSDA